MLWRFFPASEALTLCFVVFRWDMGPRRWTTRREPTSSLKTVQRLRPEVKIHQIHKKKHWEKWKWTWWTWWKWSSLKMDMFCHGRACFICFGRTWAPTTFSPAWPCCCIGRFWWTLPSLATKHDRSFFSDHQILEIRHQQIETNPNKAKIPGDLPFFDVWRSQWLILWYIFRSIWVYLHRKISFLQRCQVISMRLSAFVLVCLDAIMLEDVATNWGKIHPILLHQRIFATFLSEIWGQIWKILTQVAKWLNSMVANNDSQWVYRLQISGELDLVTASAVVFWVSWVHPKSQVDLRCSRVMSEAGPHFVFLAWHVTRLRQAAVFLRWDFSS